MFEAVLNEGRVGKFHRPKHREELYMEVAVGLEPTKIGFAGQRLDHFGIATPGKSVPVLYPKLYPNCPNNPNLRHLLPF